MIRRTGHIPGLGKEKSQYPRFSPVPRSSWLQMTGGLNTSIAMMLCYYVESNDERKRSPTPLYEQGNKNVFKLGN